MDIEKYTQGKLYMFFEWAFKLVIWNVLSLMVITIVTLIPALSFYIVSNNYSINEIYVDNDNVVVKLNNEDINIIGPSFNNINTNLISIETIRVEEDYIYLDINYNDSYTFAIPNSEEYKEIDKAYFNEDNELILYGMKKETNFGKILDSEINCELSKIDISNNVVIALQNGTKINYGNKIDTKNTLSGILIIIAVILAIFAFIPCFVTVFQMIKIFAEDGSTSTIGLFFERLWDNFKSLYKLELIILPICAIMCFALYFYYQIINTLGNNNFFYTFSYSIILITLLIFILWLVNLPMTLGYFRMHTYSIFKFTLIMTFKNILYTFVYCILYLILLVICLLNSFFIPIWFLVGISLPELLVYLLSVKKYRYLVQNLDVITKEDLEE